MGYSENVDQFIEKTWGQHDTPIGRDLTLNLKKAAYGGGLDETESALTLLSLMATAHLPQTEWLIEDLKGRDLSQEQILEAQQAPALMGLLNTYYKFKGFLLEETKADYQRAGLRMNALAKPALGKERFEMLAFAVSVYNGCPTCVVSHEKVLRDAGWSADKIHDLARMAATIKGLSQL